jgi:hypothetical protein
MLIRYFFSFVVTDEDLPIFPVEAEYLASLQDRLNLAWSIDKEDHR